MTVISTVITDSYTVHASDSFVTAPRGAGRFERLETEKTKIVRVEAFRGAMSYWGRATVPEDGSKWSTLRFLQEQAAVAGSHGSPSAFAEYLGSSLTKALRSPPFSHPFADGIGIHLSAYENFDGYWVPELFLVSNWTDLGYSSVSPEGFSVTRETYATLKGVSTRTPEHGSREARCEVLDALRNGKILYLFNNGDPVLFNTVANGIFNTIRAVQARGNLRVADVAHHRALARRPIEIVSKLLSDFAQDESRLVGGRVHDLAISSQGEYSSGSGD